MGKHIRNNIIYGGVVNNASQIILSGGGNLQNKLNNIDTSISNINNDLYDVKTSLENLIKTKTITWTTNGTGSVALDLSAPHVVIAVKMVTSDGYEVYPFLYTTGNWYAKIMNNTDKYSIVPNTSVTLLVYYI